MPRLSKAQKYLLSAIDSLGGYDKEHSVPTKKVDDLVGDMSSRFGRNNTRVVKDLLGYDLIGLDTESPMRVWLTDKGNVYLDEHNMAEEEWA